MGTLKKNTVSNTIDDPKEDVLSLEKKIIILAVTEDSNLDGVLNYKDHKLVYLFDPETSELETVLPVGFHFRKLVYNSAKNHLTLILGKNVDKQVNKRRKLPEPEIKIHIFDYDATTSKGILSGSLEALAAPNPTP